jgi:hypothetical protein
MPSYTPWKRLTSRRWISSAAVSRIERPTAPSVKSVSRSRASAASSAIIWAAICV